MKALCVDFINSEFRDFRGWWVRDELQHPYCHWIFYDESKIRTKLYCTPENARTYDRHAVLEQAIKRSFGIVLTQSGF